MSILSSKEVDALIKSAKIEPSLEKKNFEQKATTSQDIDTIKKVTLASEKKTIPLADTLEIEFEKKYPALELVLKRFLDFLEKTLAKFFDTQTKVIYHSVTENHFKKCFPEKKNFFVGYYNLSPVSSFVLLLFEIPFLENLFIAKLGADVFEKHKSKIIKEKYKDIIKHLFKILEKNWYYSWRQIYPLQTEFIDFLVLADLLATKVKKRKVVQFSFALTTLDKEFPFFIAFEEKLLSQLSKTKISISSFLSEKVKKKMFLETIAKEKVRISCSLGTYRITLQELLGLEKNDIILIDFQKGDTIFLSVADEKKFIGKFFVYKKKKAIHLTKTLD